MITLSKKKTFDASFMGAGVTVEFIVPSALEAEEHFTKEAKNSAIFSAFVTKVVSPDIEGWQNGIGAKAVLEAPGTAPLVNDTAVEIVRSAFMTEAEKNE